MLGALRRQMIVSSRSVPLLTKRCQSTLESNPNIYVFKSQSHPSTSILTLTKTNPPVESLALGTTTSVPPTPQSFKTNQPFLRILDSVIAEHAHADPQVQSQASAYASSGGRTLFQPTRRTMTGSAGASAQAGAGGAGVGGWVHISDNRHPPDFGRIADPEDIFGSVEVDGNGKFVDSTGHYSSSGTYRIVTNDGIFGLPDYLMKKLKERMVLEEAAIKNR